MHFPGVPASLWPLLQEAAAPCRIALVGGAVRDWLLHHAHLDPWRGLVDLDLVIEDPALLGRPAAALRAERSSPAARLVEDLARGAGGATLRQSRPHGQYGTVELELEMHGPEPLRLLLDVASARAETYPVPAENPVVRFGGLEDDLARRDLTINAMALDLASGSLLDPHGGQTDLAARRLRFLHPGSLRDDPTRLVRAARYAARLGFRLAGESQRQATATLAAWPWRWRPGDPPGEAPPALGTRLRRELESLLEREPWRVALEQLQAWGGLQLLDPQLQADRHWARRLHWARRFRLPLLPALVAPAADPLALAARLQLPHRQQRLLHQCLQLEQHLGGPIPGSGEGTPLSPWSWCQVLESPGLSPAAVALALACNLGPRRPLLRWWLRWRHLGPERTSRELLEAGVPPGPELGAALRQSRVDRLQRERW